MSATTIKTEVAELVRRLPDDASFEDIQYHLYVLEALKEADEDVAAGRVFTHEEVKERLKQWLTPSFDPAEFDLAEEDADPEAARPRSPDASAG